MNEALRPDDHVIHSTETQFSFVDRIRILFGRTVTVRSRIPIYVRADGVHTGKAETTAFVMPFLSRPLVMQHSGDGRT